ncbi:MAG: hypothetical protein OSJ43_16785 [Oscillospiraceae bacterium]|nr:hypothetical protein [Oscillospiraceae bacterium]
MIENENSGGYPIDDEELDNVSGGMRMQCTDLVTICPVCGSHDTVPINGAQRLCRVRGCGTIFGAMDGKVVGVEPTIANQKP